MSEDDAVSSAASCAISAAAYGCPLPRADCLNVELKFINVNYMTCITYIFMIFSFHLLTLARDAMTNNPPKILEPDVTMAVGTTLYKEVKRQLLHALAAGEWQPGEAIPAEKKLCERFSVSIGTLRKAIDELAAENILIRHQGRGTYVALHNREQQKFRFFHFAGHDGSKAYPTLELMSFSRKKAGKQAADKLRLPAASRIVEFVNLQSLQGQPVIVDEIALPEALFPGLTESMLRNRPNTLYSLYQVQFGLNVIRIEERLRAVAAGAAQARLLGVAPGAPLLQVRRVAYSYHDQPVEWRVSFVNTQRHEYLTPSAQ